MIRLLIVDDEPITRNFLKKLMDWEKCGIELVGALSDGARALEIIKSQKVHVVVTDIKMPVMNGIELMEQALIVDPDIHFLVLSGYDDFFNVSQAYKLGAKDFFLKASLSVDELKRSIQKIALNIQNAEMKHNVTANKHIDSARNILNKNSFILRQHLLSNLIFKGILPDYDTMKELDVIVSGERFRIMSLLIYYKVSDIQEMWDNDVRLIEYAVCNIVQEILDENSAGMVCVSKFAEYVLVLKDDVDPDRIFSQILVAVTRYLGFHISGGISDFGGISGLRGLHEQALTFRNRYFFIGKDVLISQHNIKSSTKQQSVEIGSKIGIMRKFLSVIGTCDALSYISRLTVESNCTDIDSIRELFDYYFHELKFFCKSNELYTGLKGRFDVYSDDLSQYGDLNDLNQWLKAVTFDIVNELHKNNNIGDLAKKFIEENYSESFSLSDLAQHFGYNNAYLSRLLYISTGMSFVKYLTQVRMEKAIELISGTDLKIYEISQRVGYENVEHFSRYFKNHTGVSPNQYKKNVLEHSGSDDEL